MSNTLFLVCPDCHLEPILQEKFGPNTTFLTALAGAFHWEAPVYAHALAHLLDMENIQEVVWAQDTSCRFLGYVLDQTGTQDLYPGQVWKTLLQQHQPALQDLPCGLPQREFLLEQLFKSQVRDMLANHLLQDKISQKQIKLGKLLFSSPERDN
ncbi:MAG: hypothetical protein ACO1OQ_10645 [Rufibacter sp.]